MERSTRKRAKKTTNLTDLLKRIPQLQHIHTDKFQELVKYHTSKISVRANEPLYKLGQSADCMYVIKKGKVLLDTLSGNVIKKKADYFGEEGLVSRSNIRIDTSITMEECELYRIENSALVDYTETCLSLPTEASSYVRPGLRLRRNDSQNLGNIEFSTRNNDNERYNESAKNEEYVRNGGSGGSGLAKSGNNSGVNINTSDYALTTTAWHNPWPSENKNNTGKLVNAALDSVSMRKMEDYEEIPNNRPFANNPALREFALKLDSQARVDSHAGAYG